MGDFTLLDEGKNGNGYCTVLGNFAPNGCNLRNWLILRKNFGAQNAGAKQMKIMEIRTFI